MVLKKVISSAFVIMIIGTLLELYLLKHYEDVLQLIPIFCIGFITIIVFLLMFFKRTLLKNIFKFLLVITACSGVYGSYLHLSGNFEFEIEMRPSASTLDLLIESFSGAFPALAPLSLVVLALIGYSYLILINQKQ